jgi:tetratricopeptide (TPR) repeat protein/tRNA A-37 threonylcarbamoyl transferase component Bud32
MHPSEEDLRRYLNQELDETDRVEVEDHVEDCSRCSEALQAMVVAGAGEIAGELERLGDADFQAYLTAPASRPAGSGGDGGPTPAVSPSSRRARARFRILCFHREGGLGRVYVARDEELGRDVALKEIRPDKVGEAHLRSRFILEAEVTGGLEHPGIVPVYSLGTYDDGRPFYAMRFVEGDSFKEAIDRFHADETLKKDVGRRSLELHKLLGRFIDVCQAIAFAHSKGVLHRDLKPDNVMLGRFGETLLIDWGLAKATGRRELSGPESTREETLVRPSGSGHAPTRGAVGTPAYMSPEQAAGAAESLGPATDVYGLGAILFALLSGEAPVEKGTTDEDTLERARRGAIRSPRSLNPNIPRALEAVCLKALALHPGDRYPTALALAEEVEHWLADEPVSAYAEPMLARLRRWGRRHRVAVAASAAASLAAALLISIWAGLEIAGRYRDRDEAVIILDRLDRQRSLPPESVDIVDARTGVNRALDLLRKDGDLTLRRRAEDAKKEVEQIQKRAKEHDEIRKEVSRLMESLEPEKALQKLTEAVERGLWQSNRELLKLYAMVLHSTGPVGSALEALRKAAKLEQSDPYPHYLLAEALARDGRVDEAIKELRALLGRFPEATNAQSLLGSLLVIKGRIDEATHFCQAAFQSRPDQPVIRYNFASIRLADNRIDEAIEVLGPAVRRSVESSREDIVNVAKTTHQLLATALRFRRRFFEADAELQRANEITPKNPFNSILIVLQPAGNLGGSDLKRLGYIDLCLRVALALRRAGLIAGRPADLVARLAPRQVGLHLLAEGCFAVLKLRILRLMMIISRHGTPWDASGSGACAGGFGPQASPGHPPADPVLFAPPFGARRRPTRRSAAPATTPAASPSASASSTAGHAPIPDRGSWPAPTAPRSPPWRIPETGTGPNPGSTSAP